MHREENIRADAEISADRQETHSKARLTLWDTVSIIIGIVVGAGIYETAPLIFKNVSGPWIAMGAWVIGGVLSLVGALCYAELASTYPRSGGDYVYLSRAYGRWAGFLFGWAQLLVIMTGSIGMMAYVFANYASQMWSFGANSMFVYACAAVVLLSVTNICGVMFGKTAQNILTLAKVLGIGGILVAGFFWSKPGVPQPIEMAGAGSFGLAMILILYTYGGWNDAAFVAAEVENKRKNIPRALILGTSAVAIIYVFMNAAYLLAIGFDGARASRAIAADVLQRPLGEFGAKAMSLLVMISALGALNGMIYTGARIYSTAGEDFRIFGWLSRWRRNGAPAASLVAQAVIAVALMTAVGTSFGRGIFNSALAGIGFSNMAWEGYGGFETLLRCTAPVFWLFFLMTGISLFLLRFKDRNVQRPFSVPLYPIVPLIFCATCVYMLYSATVYAGQLVLIGCVPLALGLILYLISSRRGPAVLTDARETSAGMLKRRTHET